MIIIVSGVTGHCCVITVNKDVISEQRKPYSLMKSYRTQHMHRYVFCSVSVDVSAGHQIDPSIDTLTLI